MNSSPMFDVVGPRGRARVRLYTVIGSIVLVFFIIGAAFQLQSHGLFGWNVWSIILDADFANLMLHGVLATVKLAVVSIVLSLAFGFVLSLCSLSKRKILRGITKVWVEIFRGVPLLVLIYFLFLGLPALHITLSTFWSMALGIMLYSSAVISEILRAGVKSLPEGQAEAALALGFGRSQTMLRVVFPQAIKTMMPTLVSQTVVILKESALGFVIGYEELLRSGRIAVDYAGTIHAIPVYLVIAVIYLSINLVLSAVAREIQARGSRKRTRAVEQEAQETRSIKENVSSTV